MQLEETSFDCEFYTRDHEYSSTINLLMLNFLLSIRFESKSDIEIYFENNLEIAWYFVFDLTAPADLLAISLAICRCGGAKRNIRRRTFDMSFEFS